MRKLNEWSYRESHAGLTGLTCEEAERLTVAKALRDVPDATAEVTEHTHTPTGRHSMVVRRVREQSNVE